MKNEGKLFGPLILISLSLGLAPFFPEPHILGKLRWVLGGANGMQPMDWFDLLLHGTPWLVLIIYSIHYFLVKWHNKLPKK
jgi:hypothetical protein